MQKNIIAIIIIVGLILVVWFFFFKSAPITNYPPKNDTIVAFGDSLVFGVGATGGNDFVSVLERKLGREVVNLGVSGNTTKDGIARIDDVLELDPGVVILLLGGNDYLRRMSKEETSANLETLITTFQAQGSVVVLLGVRGGILVDGREAVYRELSEKYGTVYVDDVLDGIFMKPELMFDSIHPNNAGYAIIADRVYEAFLKAEL